MNRKDTINFHAITIIIFFFVISRTTRRSQRHHRKEERKRTDCNGNVNDLSIIACIIIQHCELCASLFSMQQTCYTFSLSLLLPIVIPRKSMLSECVCARAHCACHTRYSIIISCRSSLCALLLLSMCCLRNQITIYNNKKWQILLLH